MGLSAFVAPMQAHERCYPETLLVDGVLQVGRRVEGREFAGQVKEALQGYNGRTAERGFS